jgi:hypothetical protein
MGGSDSRVLDRVTLAGRDGDDIARLRDDRLPADRELDRAVEDLEALLTRFLTHMHRIAVRRRVRVGRDDELAVLLAGDLKQKRVL